MIHILVKFVHFVLIQDWSKMWKSSLNYINNQKVPVASFKRVKLQFSKESNFLQIVCISLCIFFNKTEKEN